MALADSKMLSLLPKLHGESDWPIWRAKMRNILHSSKMWEMVQGNEVRPDNPQPPENNTAAERDRYKREKQVFDDFETRWSSCRTFFTLSVDDEVFQLFSEMQSPVEIWNFLVRHFDRPTLSNKVNLLTKLLELKLNPGHPVEQYFTTFMDIRSRLTQLDFAVGEELAVAILLKGLPTEFEIIRQTFLVRGDAVTINELQEALKTEENRRNGQQHPNSVMVGSGYNSMQGNTGTFYGKGRGQSTRGQSTRGQFSGQSTRGQFSGRGQTSGQSFRGSYRGRNGRRNNRISRGGGQNYTKGCFQCGKSGHFARDCDANLSTVNQFTENSEGILTAIFGCSLAEFVSNRFLVDSGATSHMAKDVNLFSDYHKLETPRVVTLGDDSTTSAVGVGNIWLRSLNPGKNSCEGCWLTNVLHVPKLAGNFISVPAATHNGNAVQFTGDAVYFVGQNGKLVAKGDRDGNAYFLTAVPEKRERQKSVVAAVQRENKEATTFDIQQEQILTLTGNGQYNGDILKLWHHRLGHCGVRRMTQAVSKDLVHGITLKHHKGYLDFCEGCAQGKLKRKPYGRRLSVQSRKPLDLIHSDVCGPMRAQSLGGAQYFVTFIDDWSRWCEVYPLKSKDETFSKFKEFATKVENQFGHKIKILRSDNGGEYCNTQFGNYLKENGILHQTTVPYSPSQNGVAERRNRLIQEMSVAMMTTAELSQGFWAEAMTTSVFIQNRLPTDATGVTPFERWYSRKPVLKYLRVFGSPCYCLKSNTERKKFESLATYGIFLGYPQSQKGWRIWIPDQRRVIVSRDVIFNETAVLDKKMLETEVLQKKEEKMIDEAEDELMIDEAENVEDEQQRKSKRQRQPPQRFGDFATEREMAELNRLGYCVPWEHHHLFHMVDTTKEFEPATIQEAFNCPDAEKWKAAAQKEFDSLQEMKTWTLVPLPSGRTPVSCRWLFRRKFNPDGSVERYKARLVARGFSQQFGVDYNETFSPVVRFNTLRALLAIAVSKQMLLHQMDVTTAFLNGDLEEEIYMEQPNGFVEKGKEKLVCRLNRSLYGLKQAPRCWNTKFVNFLKAQGFKQLKTDYGVFVRSKPFTMLTVYVDDLILFTQDLDQMKLLKEELKTGFKMVDNGELHYMLGIQFEKMDNGSLKMHQQNYIEKILDKFKMSSAAVASTPADPAVTLKKTEENENLVNPTLYQSMIGSLLYVALGTRPDIQFSVGLAARFSSQPSTTHLTAVKRIFKYLAGTRDLGILFQSGGDVDIVGFSDANWARDLDDRKSTSGFCFYIAHGLVSWYSGKQKSVATSTCNAEYIALGAGIREGLFLSQLLQELNPETKTHVIKMKCDNQATIAISKNPVFHSRQKHVDIQYHFIRDEVQKGSVILEYCPSTSMVADMFTKAIPRNLFQKHRSDLTLL